MAVPFRKVSKTRKRMRRSHNALEVVGTTLEQRTKIMHATKISIIQTHTTNGVLSIRLAFFFLSFTSLLTTLTSSITSIFVSAFFVLLL